MLATVPASGTLTQLYYDPADVDAVKEQMRRDGYIQLGSIHTHPGSASWGHPSETDNRGALEDGDLVMGIMRIWRSGPGRLMTRVRWWRPQLPYEDVALV